MLECRSLDCGLGGTRIQVLIMMVYYTSGAMDVDGAPEGDSIKKGKRKIIKHSKGKRRAAAVFPGLKASSRGKIQRKGK